MKTKKQDAQSGEADSSHMTKLLRARCRKELLDLTKRAAEILELDESDIIRIGTKQYAASVVYRDPLAHAA